MYSYKTRENERCEGLEIVAASRENAYARLRQQGIRPYEVVLAPGFFNWLASWGKRVWAILGLSAALIAAVIGLICGVGPNDSKDAVGRKASEFLTDMTRRQIVGDAAIIEKGIRTGWADVFPHEGERFLASFAVPGVPAAQRTTTEDEIKSALARTFEEYDIPSVSDRNYLEARQILSMVEGMKQECREFLADGGSIVEYGRALVRRQEEELGYYNRALTELRSAEKSGRSDGELIALWETRNASLRRMGIKLLPMPNEER